MKTQTLGFPKFYPTMTVMGLRSAAAKELRYYFTSGERVRFLFTICEESQTNERVFERVCEVNKIAQAN